MMHISDIVIYDKPRNLSGFSPCCKYKSDDGCCDYKKGECIYQDRDYNPDGNLNVVSCRKRVQRPPQSWCYVEEMK